MDLAAAIIGALKGASEVTALVEGRINWLRRPQGAPLPAIVLSQISRVSEGDTLEGEGPVWSSRVQADCLASGAEGFKTARAIAKAVRKVAADLPQAEGIDLFGADIEGPTDFTEDATGGPLFRVSLDLIIRHGEED